MKRRKKKRSRTRGGATTPIATREGKANKHAELKNNDVHVFVDDQNLFWGIVNEQYGPGFRIDFGRLLTVACRNSQGTSRFVRSAYIAGVIPDDDSFWRIAENRGFTVRRGFLGQHQRSKQDDAYLITDLTAAVYEEEEPSTIVLVAGDADYVPPLERALLKGWRNEIAFIDRGVSATLESVVHEFRTIGAHAIEYLPE